MRSILSESRLAATDISRARLLRFFFFHPFHKEVLKFVLGVDTFMNEQRVHSVDCRLECLIPRSEPHSFLVGHKVTPSAASFRAHLIASLPIIRPRVFLLQRLCRPSLFLGASSS